jgi:16S rRNA (cytosine1402-N4)-methyltransferase
MEQQYHAPVMAHEVMELISAAPGKVLVDGTAGGGGHSAMLLQTGAALIAIDRDADAIAACSRRFEGESRLTLVRGNFFNIPQILDELDIPHVDGILLDLGVSSYQLDTPQRGFSYRFDGPLDMRMDDTQVWTAYTIVNTYDVKQLRRMISEYGEERFANSIARKIVEYRKQKPIETTLELVDIIRSAIPAAARETGGHPAKRTFQALRIELNGELETLYECVQQMTLRLKPGGRICVITFHSLEDRIIKNAFRDMEKPCTCPPKTPICICKKEQTVRILTKKPILPTKEEVALNNRAHSAKLRAAERI